MIYTKRTQLSAVTLQQIKPIDTRIVRATFSVRVPGYRERFSDVIFDAYEKLALKGTRTRSDDDIDAYIRNHGLVFNVSAAHGYVHFSVTAEAAQFKHGVALVRELIHETVFHESHVSDSKKLLREENREAHDDAQLRAEIAFANILYPKNSHSSMLTLSEEASLVRTVTKSQLTSFHRSLICGEWFISCVGDDTSVSLIRPFARTLSRTAQNVIDRFSHTAFNTRISQFITVPGKANVEVRIGAPLPMNASDAELIPFLFGLAVLGKTGGFSGRLMSTVREKKGLTYGIYARTENVTRTTHGHWNVITFFTARDLAAGIAATEHEIRNIVTRGITRTELLIFKEILKNQFTLSHESNARRLSIYHAELLEGNTEAHLLSTMEHIVSLTQDEVNRALSKYIDPAHHIIVCAGPVDADGVGIVAS